MRRKEMVFGFMLEGAGRSSIDWKLPGAAHNAGSNFAFHKQQALTAEAAKLDFLFVADTIFFNHRSPPHMMNRFESMVLLSGLAAVTERVGLVGTISSTFAEPYNVARQFASLEHVSGGRSAWNVVTSTADASASNYGPGEMPSHDDRYAMAGEFLEVVQGLWDSWEDDGLVQNRETGQFFDPDKLHTLNHKGKYYEVAGPLNLIRSPQGQPLIFCAGTSGEGRNFAARYADALFYNPESMEEAQAYYADVKARRETFGRDPDTLFLCPSTKPVVGSTEAEAEEKYQARIGQISVPNQLRLLNRGFPDIDFSKEDLDAPFPQRALDSAMNGFQGSAQRIARLVRDEKATLRQIAARFGRPRRTFVGTPEQIADKMQKWFEGRAVDGYIIGETQPGEFKLFCDEVLPILRKRGYFRTEYEGATLRDHLGLEKPRNRFVVERERQAAQDAAE